MCERKVADCWMAIILVLVASHLNQMFVSVSNSRLFKGTSLFCVVNATIDICHDFCMLLFHRVGSGS